MKLFAVLNISFYLIFSPTLFADNLPKRVEINFLSSSEQYIIEKFHSDYVIYNVLNPDKKITIQKEFTKDISVEEISSSLRENGSKLVAYAVSVPTSFESKSSILLTGEINPENDSFLGQIRRADGSIIEEVNIKAFKNDGDLRAVIVVIVGGLALVGVACAIANMLTNCGSECADACGSSGVERYRELYCGRCECECKK